MKSFIAKFSSLNKALDNAENEGSIVEKVAQQMKKDKQLTELKLDGDEDYQTLISKIDKVMNEDDR